MSFKIIIFDMDGVLFKDIYFWLEVHRSFGTLKEGKILTEKYLHTDYDALVDGCMKLWKGKDAKPYFDLINSLEYLPGVKKIMDFVKNKDLVTGIVSGSSIHVARRVQKDFGIDHLYANQLVIRDGKVAGEFIWPIGAGFHKKAEVILQLCSQMDISPKDVIYVGDTKLDIDAFKVVGLSIAFNTRSEELKKIATHVIDGSDLNNILPILKNALE